jgi:hypothetical protein
MPISAPLAALAALAASGLFSRRKDIDDVHRRFVCCRNCRLCGRLPGHLHCIRGESGWVGGKRSSARSARYRSR